MTRAQSPEPWTTGPEADHADIEPLAAVLADSGMPAMAARVLVTLMADEDGAASTRELIDRLGVSPASVSSTTAYLTAMGMVERTRVPGSRALVYRLIDHTWYAASLAKRDRIVRVRDATTELLDDPRTPDGAADRLREMAEFMDFVDRRMNDMLDEWNARRR